MRVLKVASIFLISLISYYRYDLTWDDPAIGIDWPLTATQPSLSAKDQQGLALREVETF